MIDRNSPSERGGAAVLLLAVASAVLGGHLLLISALGSPMPFWDQWDAEANSLYAPYLAGNLSWTDLFASHNEHRILVTRLLALLHLELAGEWNPRLEMILGAIVHAGLVTWLTALLMPLVASERRLLFAVFVAFMFALPIGFENTIWGFQSQFYFVALFSLGALASFAAGTGYSLKWFAGVVFSILSYVSFSSGTATILVAAVLMTMQLAVGRRERSAREVLALATMVGVGITMLAFVQRSPSQLPFDWWTFVQGFIFLTALPLVTIGGVLFVQGPALWLTYHTVATRPPGDSRLWVAVAIAGWVAAQAILFAYGRGAVMGLRYLDILILSYPIGFVAILRLADSMRESRAAKLATPVAVSWIFVMVALLAVLAYYSSLRGAIEWSEGSKRQVASVTAYLEGGEMEVGADLPYPDPQRLADILAKPDIRAILPPEIRPADADVDGARNRMLLKGALADATANAVRVVLLIPPAFIALALALFFAAAASAALRPRHANGEVP